jgi:hypothetical protein
MVVPILDADDYPPNVARSLDPDPNAEVLDDKKNPITPSYGAGISVGSLEVIAKVAKRRKMSPAYYQRHQRRPMVVEVGSMWRGVFGAMKLDEDNGQHLGPQVRVFELRLPESKKTAEPPLAGVDAS